MLTQPIKAKVQSLVARSVVYARPLNHRKAGVYRENVYVTKKSVIVPRTGLSADILPLDHAFMEHSDALDFYTTKQGARFWFVYWGSAHQEKLPRMFEGHRQYIRSRSGPFYWQQRIVNVDGTRESVYGLEEFRKKEDAVKYYNEALKELQSEARRAIRKQEKFIREVAALRRARV